MPIDPNEPFDPEDGESDAEAEMRALAARRRAALGQGRADDDDMKKRGTGRKVAPPPEFSDPDDPTKKQGDVYPGDIAPAMAGQREKIDQAGKRLTNFVNRYAHFAVDKFYGYKAGTVKKMDSELGDMRVGKRGGVLGAEQTMDKDAALKLVEQLPTMPQDRAFQAQKSLYHYFHRVFSNARKHIRDVVHKDMGYDSKPKQVAKTDAEGNTYYVQEYDWETTEYESQMEDAMEALEKEKTQVLSDLNLLAGASGALQRATGRYGKADATYLDKKARWMKPPAVIAKQPDVALGPQMRGLAGPAPAPPPSKKGAPAAPVRAQGPIIRKKNQESIDWFLNNIIETAVADRVPQWWDDI